MKTNDNCLAGIRCPSCGSEGSFWVDTECLAEWTDDGVGEIEYAEFKSDGYARCVECDWQGETIRLAETGTPRT